MSKNKTASIVTEGYTIRVRIKELQKELKDLETELMEYGVGEYEDSDGQRALVIQPKDSFGTPKEAQAFEAVKELLGETFPKLFERTITYSPVKSFEDVAKALLPPKVFKKVLDLMRVGKAAYIKWS